MNLTTEITMNMTLNVLINTLGLKGVSDLSSDGFLITLLTKNKIKVCSIKVNLNSNSEFHLADITGLDLSSEFAIHLAETIKAELINVNKINNN